MSRLFLSIAICFPSFFCLDSHAHDSAAGQLSAEYAAALFSGAEHACRQPERAKKRFAHMLRASCVAAAMRAEKDRREIVQLCYGARHGRALSEIAEATCKNWQI